VTIFHEPKFASAFWGGERGSVGYGLWSELSRFVSGFGTSPSFGFSMFGPTAIPTYWVNYPGVGNVPMAVPVGGWSLEGTPGSTVGLQHAGQHISPQHRGGRISLPGFQRGGAVGSTLSGSRAAGGASQIHIYNFTDPRAMVRHMASRSGRKIIVDTVQGRRIDLGI
jgi:hypothetical protein